MNGKIVSTLGGVYTIYCEGVTYNVFPRGVFRYKNMKLYVGDNVNFDETKIVINSIEPRKNEIIRPKCANIDQMFIVMSVNEPLLSEELLYKFLIYANMNSIPASVIFTKLDILENSIELEKIMRDLNQLKIKTFCISKNDPKSIENIRFLFKNKVSVILGQTGVGKSTLINLIDPLFERRIGEYSRVLGRGKHQTKEVILLPFENGFIADTPGFSSLDLNLFKEDLAIFFPGYTSYYTKCYFSNCLHLNEKNCHIKEQITNGNLSKEGYDIYLKLLNNAPYKSERFNK